MEKVNLTQKFSTFAEHWDPRIAGELNGQYIKLVKFQGPFTWHHHEDEDEMFMVVRGRFRMDFKDEGKGDSSTWIEEGEFIVVPRGVDHRPAALDAPCEVVLIAPPADAGCNGPKDHAA